MKTKRITSKKKQVLSQLTVGIDIGDQWSHYCMLSAEGSVIEEGRMRTTANAQLNTSKVFRPFELRIVHSNPDPLLAAEVAFGSFESRCG